MLMLQVVWKYEVLEEVTTRPLASYPLTAFQK